VSHANAKLAPKGRLALARCVVDDGWPVRRAAERFQVSPTTATRWAGRYRLLGQAGMADRSSRPHRCPRRTPTRTERRIIKVRVIRRWGPARIAYLLGLHPSTVHRVLTRFGVARLRWLDRATGRVIRRYERATPGELVHVDIKKLGRIPDGGGHKKLGRTLGNHNNTHHNKQKRLGYGSATPTCTTPLMTTPAWPTPRSSATNARRPPRRSGSAPTTTSPAAASRSRGC